MQDVADRGPTWESGEVRARVVRTISRLAVGGPGRHVVWLAAGLRERGYETILVTGRVPPGEKDMTYFATAHGVEPFVFAELSREICTNDVVSIWKLYRLLVRTRPSIVHTHTAKAGTVGRVAGLLYRWLTPGALVGRPRSCRFVHTYHGHIFHSYYGPLKTWFFLTIERLLARVATDCIIVLSPQQYDEIHGRFRVGRAGQFAIVPLGLDLDQFDASAERRSLLRAELGVGEADLVVAIIGRLTEIKNHSLFLRAAAEVRHRSTAPGGPRVRFVVIGDGLLRPRLEAEAAALGLQEDVSFLGTRDDRRDFYPGIDVVAITSHNEGTPLALIEAMANGRAVISTAVGGVVDLIGERRPDWQAWQEGYQLCTRGMLVTPNDPAAFARGLARLLADEPLREELGRLGEEFARQHYSKERLCSDMDALYARLLGIKAPSSVLRPVSLPDPTLSMKGS